MQVVLLVVDIHEDHVELVLRGRLEVQYKAMSVCND